MRRVLALAALSATLATQTAALSCMYPDVARTYARVAADDAPYVVLLGQFRFDPEPFAPSLISPKPDAIPATFEGEYLGADGFVPAPPLDITLDFLCAGPWCGSLDPTATEILAFVRQTETGYVLTVSACNDTAFQNPSAQDIGRIEDCMRGGPCAELPQ